MNLLIKLQIKFLMIFLPLFFGMAGKELQGWWAHGVLQSEFLNIVSLHYIFISCYEPSTSRLMSHLSPPNKVFIYSIFLFEHASFEMFLNTFLIKFWQSDLKLKKFLHIIEDSPVYPVIYDSKRYYIVIVYPHI